MPLQATTLEELETEKAALRKRSEERRAAALARRAGEEGPWQARAAGRAICVRSASASAAPAAPVPRMTRSTALGSRARAVPVELWAVPMDLALCGAVTVVPQQKWALCGAVTVVPQQKSALCGAVTVVPQQKSALCDAVTVVPQQKSTLCDAVTVVPQQKSALCDAVNVVPQQKSALCGAVIVVPQQKSALCVRKSQLCVPADVSSGVRAEVGYFCNTLAWQVAWGGRPVPPASTYNQAWGGRPVPPSSACATYKQATL